MLSKVTERVFMFFCFIVFHGQLYSQTDACSSLADLQTKNNNSFVGYGSGQTQFEADQNAQIDLARQIRQKVTATATVEENNFNSNLSSNTKSVVQEILIGAKILKRCSGENKFSTVVTLDKDFFINSLAEKLTITFNKANSLKKSIENAKAEEVLANAIETAKDFINNYQQSCESDLELCKIYKGCSNITFDNSFRDLINAVAKNAETDQYVLIIEDQALTNEFQEDLLRLLEEDNVKIMNSKVAEKGNNTSRKILANCKFKAGLKIPGTEDKIAEIRCLADAYSGKQKKFQKIYSCKAIMDTQMTSQDAISSCVGRLQKD